MDEAARKQLTSRIKTGALLAGAAIAVGLVVGGVFIFLLRDSSPQTAAAGANPFDVAEVPKTALTAPGGATRPAPAASSLSMVGKFDGGGTAPAAAPQSPIEKAALGFREAIRGSEKTLGDLARDYTRRYPIIRQYGRDWMSYPDLKKLNDDYMRDHDPIAFLRGLAASPSFPKLVQKYAGQPAVQSFVRDCVTKAPSGAVGASMDYITKDKALDGFVQDVAGKAGVPAALLNAQVPTDGSAPDIDKLAADALRGMPMPQPGQGQGQPPGPGRR